MRKKHNWNMCFGKPLMLVVAITIILSVCCLTACRAGSAESTMGSIHFEDGAYYPANFRQTDSNVQLGLSEGHLYMFDNMRERLFRFESGHFKMLRRFKGSWIGIDDGFFYYRKSSDDTEFSIVRYDIEARETAELAKTKAFSHNDIFFSEDGIIHIPTDIERSSYLRIDGSGHFDSTVETESYKVGGYTFELHGSEKKKYIVAQAPDGSFRSYEAELNYGDLMIIPCKTGILVHNKDSGNVLYYIECESGQCIELFSTDCIYSRSAVNVRGNNVYLSLARYTQFGDLDLAGVIDEADPVNGTYCIDLNGYSVEKLNDNIYIGLFIYDNNGIFACDLEGRVYYLNPEGTVISELTK